MRFDKSSMRYGRRRLSAAGADGCPPRYGLPRHGTSAPAFWTRPPDSLRDTGTRRRPSTTSRGRQASARGVYTSISRARRKSCFPWWTGPYKRSWTSSAPSLRRTRRPRTGCVVCSQYVSSGEYFGSAATPPACTIFSQRCDRRYSSSGISISVTKPRSSGP